MSKLTCKMDKSKVYSSIDEHPSKEQIVKDILAQKSYGEIKKKYNLNSVQVLKTFVSNRLVYPAAQASEKVKQDSREIIMGRLDEIQGYLSKLIKACDEWLADPDDKDRYYLGDRADELTVVWLEERAKGKLVKKRDSLQHLLDIALDTERGKALQYVQTGRTDTRKLLLEALRVAQQQVELIAKITGEMHEITMSVDVYGVVLPHIIAVINSATEGRPDIQRRIYEGLAEISDIHDAQLEKGY